MPLPPSSLAPGHPESGTSAVKGRTTRRGDRPDFYTLVSGESSCGEATDAPSLSTREQVVRSGAAPRNRAPLCREPRRGEKERGTRDGGRETNRSDEAPQNGLRRCVNCPGWKRLQRETPRETPCTPLSPPRSCVSEDSCFSRVRLTASTPFLLRPGPGKNCVLEQRKRGISSLCTDTTKQRRTPEECKGSAVVLAGEEALHVSSQERECRARFDAAAGASFLGLYSLSVCSVNFLDDSRFSRTSFSV
ncbi:hypothetical protein TGDOM2_213380 [Toxoplasma gondii GAB2-2007-GAL-DOM2]|uniref:Uncharacterized protein n=3 Tax=Toxoplasma gondii TaxID=5811 RepID=B9QGG5_TOXGV|nr:hypothetical protein TGVEG_213380 [Toxoplasma gondii VEG]KFG40347.1 hypothetical protein TGDOM2_213380 [Toxoplasma gondii GAB2-2007-GAL-DOM2]KFG44330.1 hypothetical protein TGP89_213380 [Toxoplasma gondii p89]CEL72807.1 TPA: hypothetical protein BN1205_034960 [Toxoplasma gondii VEG]